MYVNEDTAGVFSWVSSIFSTPKQLTVENAQSQKQYQVYIEGKWHDVWVENEAATNPWERYEYRADFGNFENVKESELGDMRAVWIPADKKVSFIFAVEDKNYFEQDLEEQAIHDAFNIDYYKNHLMPESPTITAESMEQYEAEHKKPYKPIPYAPHEDVPK